MSNNLNGRTPALLALAITGKLPSGPNRCYFCGSACHGLHSKKQHVKSTFTDFSSCVDLSSQFVCDGCVLAMREKVDMPGRDKPQKTRNYSWVITSNAATPYSKAQIPELRAICLNPPAPPYSLVLAVSGQKQLIFKSLIHTHAKSVSASLEGQSIQWLPGELEDHIEIVAAIAAICGKMSLTATPTLSMAMQLSDALGKDGVQLYESWNQCWSEPLSRLAAFLSPSKKELENVDDNSNEE